MSDWLVTAVAEASTSRTIFRKAPRSNAPRSSSEGAPRYSFARGLNGRRRFSKIHIDDVREIRKWAVREGWGMTIVDQARVQQLRYPGLSLGALHNILSNATWHDPAYDRDTPHEEWATLPVALVLILLIRQMYTLVSSPGNVEVLEQPGPSQGGDAVLDGAPVQPRGVSQALRSAHAGFLERGEHVARR